MTNVPPRPVPLAEQIAASIEDVNTLLENNRSLSVAFLHHRLRDHEEEVRKRFREMPYPCQAVQAAEAAIEKLEHRLDQAGVKFREMREEIDKLKASRKTERANNA